MSSPEINQQSEESNTSADNTTHGSENDTQFVLTQKEKDGGNFADVKLESMEENPESSRMDNKNLENSTRTPTLTENAKTYATKVLKIAGFDVEGWLKTRTINDKQEKMASGQKEALKIGGKLEDMNRRIATKEKLLKSLNERAEKPELSGKIKANLRLQAVVLQQKIDGEKAIRDATNDEYQKQKTRMDIGANTRDRAVDDYLRDIEKIMAPLQQKLKDWEVRQNNLESAEKAIAERHRNLQIALDDSARERAATEDMLRSDGGMTEKEINENLISYDEELAEGLKLMQEDKKILADRKTEIEIGIASVKERLAPHLSKWHKYQRMKGIRPVENEKADPGPRIPVKTEERKIRPSIN